MKRYPIHSGQMVAPFQPFSLCDIQFEAFPVIHSLIAPAVGYRITTGAASILYVPDVAEIRDRHKVIPGLRLYVGDGASVTRPLLRRRGNTMIGHASIRDQLEWWREHVIKQAIITHCGSHIVRGGRSAIQRIQALAKERGLEIFVAHDGMQMSVSELAIRFLD